MNNEYLLGVGIKSRRNGRRLRITFTMSGDFAVGEFMRVDDNELAICHPCCGFCEEAKEVITGEIPVLPFGVRCLELGKYLVVGDEDFGGELHGVDTTVTRYLAEATITIIDSRCHLAEVRRSVVEVVTVNVVDVVALLWDVMEGTEDEIVHVDMVRHSFVFKH